MNSQQSGPVSGRSDKNTSKQTLDSGDNSSDNLVQGYLFDDPEFRPIEPDGAPEPKDSLNSLSMNNGPAERIDSVIILLSEDTPNAYKQVRDWLESKGNFDVREEQASGIFPALFADLPVDVIRQLEQANFDSVKCIDIDRRIKIQRREDLRGAGDWQGLF